MAEKPNSPGPGKSTADAAFNAIRKNVAERNEKAHREDRKRREPRERALAEKRRTDSLR